MAYCEHFSESDYLRCKKIFVNVVGVHFPEFTKKVKVHLLLHLADCMMDLARPVHSILKGSLIISMIPVVINIVHLKV